MNLTQEQYDAWIAALKENKYEQTTGLLFFQHGSEKSYCCMGVCGVVLGLSDEQMEDVYVLSHLTDMPHDVQRTFTLIEENVLGHLNDALELTFPQIAAFVQAGALDAYRFQGGTIEEIGVLGS